MLYEKPEIEILVIEMTNVVCASVGDIYNEDDGNISSGSGSWLPPTE